MRDTISLAPFDLRGRGLMCGVSALAFGAMLLAGPAAAQTTDETQEPEVEQTAPSGDVAEVGEVVVTGIRASLRNAQSIKENADVFVDAVTADDIGALPDRSVTEALQRVPGVSINRFAGASDPDHFSVEGSGVVIRGLNFVRSELNGRDTFSANNGRDLSFADVPSELLGSVEVFKNASAEMIEGGIGGTVNLNTRKPFDSPGRVVAFTTEASWGDMRHNLAPTISLLGSDRWDTALGEFGLLLSGVHSELDSRAEGLQSLNYRLSTVDGEDRWTPSGLAFRTQEFDRRRDGIAAAGQWRSNDRRMVATLQYLRSDSQQAWLENAIESVVDDTGNRQPLAGTDWTYNADGLFTGGAITSTADWRSADPSVPLNGIQHLFVKRGVVQDYVTSDYGFNFKWTPTDRLRLNFDAQYVDSTVDVIDFQLTNSFFAVDVLDLTGDLPSLALLAPDGGDIDAYLADPSNYFWRNAMDHIEQSEGDEYAFKADVEYDLNTGWLESVKVGARFAERDQTTRNSAYNWGVISEIWNGATGPVWLDQGATATPRLTGGLDHASPYSFNGMGVPVTTFGYAGNPAQSYGATTDFVQAMNAIWGGNGWVPLAGRSNVVPGTPFTPGEINTTNEQTSAAYLMLKFNNGADPVWGESISISGNVGVRYVETKIAAEGALSFPTQNQVFSGTCAPPVGGGELPAFCQLTPEQQAAALAFATGASIPETAEHSYDNWLPSLNVKFGLTPEFLVRFGYSQAIRRSDLGLTRDQVPIQPRVIDNIFLGFEAQAGNTYLDPIKSEQFDLSGEWYFAPTGSLTLSLFHKTLSDVITNGYYDRTITNNGQTFDVYVRGPTNSAEEGTVQGLELAYQQFYDFLPGWLSGFGVQANYTYIDSSGVPQENLDAGKANPGGSEPTIDTSLLPLEGLSEHNANFTAIYENEKVSARLAYSWRSEFLLTTRDEIVPFAPIMSDATGQLDGSIFYSVNDRVKVGVQAVNLLNETTKTFQVLDDTLQQAPRSWFRNDRRFSFIVRGTF
ncbi:TonB-dependent receptor [Brevundimonas sp. UBA7534]|uniref:TonB-dependent receptor n=1 Tax=Brevundimonas sp. UBA7534 TaxID=1946138 RepID=UPI0025BF9346|nr:TonB-dependent receptor [Brevundimonas sp. UBA7534]